MYMAVIKTLNELHAIKIVYIYRAQKRAVQRTNNAEDAMKTTLKASMISASIAR